MDLRHVGDGLLDAVAFAQPAPALRIFAPGVARDEDVALGLPTMFRVVEVAHGEIRE